MKQDGADEGTLIYMMHPSGLLLTHSDYLQNRWLPITDEGIVGYNLCK